MGNIRGKQQKHEKINRIQFLEKINSSHKGEELHSCSLSRWAKSSKTLCGFTDLADYVSVRDPCKSQGILVKPDLTNGRYFHPHFKKSHEVLILEKESWTANAVKLPRVPLPDVHDDRWVRQPRHQMRHESSVVAYHDGLLVIQAFTDNRYLTPKFYVIDLEKKECVASFIMVYQSKRWYECYISPNKTRILIRPDHLNRVLVVPDNYVVQNLNINCAQLKVRVVAPILRQHCLTFNIKLGDEMFVTAFGRDLEVRRTDSWELMRQESFLCLPAGIQQIKSSALGDFITVRCVTPVHSNEFTVNMIGVFNFPELDLLFMVNVKGRYWPISEVTNLQVFPHFSPSEAAIAMMQNTTYKRRIYVYKLPIITDSLKHICRRALLHLVHLSDIRCLPIPENLKEYLQFAH